jgi:hypothetical protein
MFETPVAAKLSEICDASNVLFAEERQNLYIDDVREIEIWTRILQLTGCHNLLPNDNAFATTWVSQGLEEVVRVLEYSNKTPGCLRKDISDADEGSDGITSQHTAPAWVQPLGCTYDRGTLLPLLKVVSLAGVVLKTMDNTAHSVQVRKRLMVTHGLCMNGRVSQAFSAAVTTALSQL